MMLFIGPFVKMLTHEARKFVDQFIVLMGIVPIFLMTILILILFTGEATIRVLLLMLAAIPLPVMKIVVLRDPVLNQLLAIGADGWYSALGVLAYVLVLFNFALYVFTAIMTGPVQVKAALRVKLWLMDLRTMARIAPLLFTPLCICSPLISSASVAQAWGGMTV